MAKQTIVVLTDDEDFAASVRRAKPSMCVVAIPYSRATSSLLQEPEARVMIDLGSIPASSLHAILEGSGPMERITLSRSEQDGRRDLPPAGEALATGPSTGRLSAHPRSAWVNRGHVLSLEGRPDRPRRFIDLARLHDHEGYTVSEAAVALHVSLRDLYRLSGRGLGYPPGVIIDLARADSLGRDLIQTGSSSVNIALAHGFHDQSTMNRLFMRFVGLSPGFYRAAGRRPHR